MAPYVNRYFIEKKHLHILENWTEDIFINSKIKEINNRELNFVIAGNLGEAQGIPDLINSMPKLGYLLEILRKKF